MNLKFKIGDKVELIKKDKVGPNMGIVVSSFFDMSNNGLCVVDHNPAGANFCRLYDEKELNHRFGRSK